MRTYYVIWQDETKSYPALYKLVVRAKSAEDAKHIGFERRVNNQFTRIMAQGHDKFVGVVLK